MNIGSMITCQINFVFCYLMLQETHQQMSRWHSEREHYYDNIFNHFYAVRPESYRIRWNNAK